MNKIVKYSSHFIILLVIVLQACKNQNTSSKTSQIDGSLSQEYAEPHRPQFHFSPPANWMNDPNGMVYYDGEYHLFYQYYPDSTVWGPMHWGHAVSKDMVHWDHLPIALYPDSLGYIFSGSAVIDHGNTSGLGTDGKDPMIAIFTHHNMDGERSGSNTFQYQSIAYSNDNGRTFTKYSGNPVISNPGIRDFRDPKVIWDEQHQLWIMVFAAYDQVKFYSSKDLKSWSFLNDWGKEYGGHGGVWECPDFFPLKCIETGEQKWVLLQSINPGGPNGGSGTQYFIGEFDGKTFSLDSIFEQDVINGKAVWLDYGKDNYAGVTWSNISDQDGRKLFLGWMSNWEYAQVVPTHPWRSAMTLPRSLELHHSKEGYRIHSLPIAELSSLQENQIQLSPKHITDDLTLVEKDHQLYKLELSFKKPQKSNLEIKVSNSLGEYILIGFNPQKQEYFMDRTNAGTASFSEDFTGVSTVEMKYKTKEMAMTIYLDVSSVELFADKGRIVMTELFFPTQPFNKISINGKSDIELTKGTLTELSRIW